MNPAETVAFIYIGIAVIGYIVGWFWSTWWIFTTEDDFLDAGPMVLGATFFGVFIMGAWPISLLVGGLWYLAQRKREADKARRRSRY